MKHYSERSRPQAGADRYGQQVVLHCVHGCRFLRPDGPLFLLSSIFGDVHDLVLEDEQVWRAFARQPHHVLIVILDPSADHLAIHQFDVDQFLFLTQSLEEAGFFEGLFGGRGPAALGGIGISLRAERHADIVHGDDWGQV